MPPFAEHIVHLDMDAFFVEVERLRHPRLKGRPVLVGGRGPRAVVAAASYEARTRGAHSAMPMAHALRLAPGAEVVAPDLREYRRVSNLVFEVLARFSPTVERLGIDEAFIDIAGLHRHHSSPVDCGNAMRMAIRDEVGLPASAGIATTKFLAKMASRDAKPDGIVVVSAGSEKDFLHPKPIGELWGVGQVTRARLEELGVLTVGDLVSLPVEALERRLGLSVGRSLWDLANGRDARIVGEEPMAKSVSVEETYPADLVTSDAIDRQIVALSDRLATRLRRAGLVAGTVQVKVRYPDFTTVGRSRTCARPVITSAEILGIARDLVGETAAVDRGVRLLGIGAGGFADADEPRQLGFGDDGWEAVDAAVGRVRDRFGVDAVGRARLVESGPSREEEPPFS